MPTLYVTVPPEAAEEMARRPVEERLEACVNRVACQSTYRWEGQVHDDSEEVLFEKTTAEAAGETTARVRELHPHDVPCVERFDGDDVLDEYAAWVAGAVDPK